jgi:hypothetical protein
MADHQDTWTDPATPPPGWLPPPVQPARPPSGLFPGFAGPSRPTWREPFPVTTGPLLAGLGGALLWLALVGLLAADLRGYGWLTLLAALCGWGAAAVLARMGDRGVAVGVAIGTGVGWSVAAVAVGISWATTGNWPLW